MKKDLNPMVSKHIVAYIDVLGYRDLISSKKKQVNELLLGIRHLITDVDYFGKELSNGVNVKLKAFSDNIVLCIPVNDDDCGRDDAYEFLNIVAYVQGLMLSVYHLMSRGSIVIGDLYLDDDFVFGEALIEAYELESSVAIEPRIVVSTGFCKYYMNINCNISCEGLVAKDDRLFVENGIISLDILKSIYKFVFSGGTDETPSDESIISMSSKLIAIHNGIIISIRNCFTESKGINVVKKYLWLVNYFNAHFNCDDALYIVTETVHSEDGFLLNVVNNTLLEGGFFDDLYYELVIVEDYQSYSRLC